MIRGSMRHGVVKEVATVARSRIAFGLAMAPLLIAVGACGMTAATDAVESASPPASYSLVPESATVVDGIDSELCWAVTSELPVMELANLDPESAKYFVEWGRYMKEVDSYLSDGMPFFEGIVDQASGPEQAALVDALTGVNRMKRAVRGAARTLVKAKDPVRERTVRTFYLASNEFLEGLYTVCPSWRDDQMSDPQPTASSIA